MFLLAVLVVASATVVLAQSDDDEDTATATPRISIILAPDVFVRGGPGDDYLPVGSLVAGDVVRGINRSEDSEWVMTPYGFGFGWVRRDLAFWIEDIDSLPVLTDDDLTPTPDGPENTATPFIPTVTPAGNFVDTTAQSAYLRAGPGIGYVRIGQLVPGDVVEPVARNEEITWVMIRYTAQFLDPLGTGTPSPVEFAWIAENLVAWSEDLEALPLVDEDNLTPTPTFTPSISPSPTFTPSDTPTITPTPTASNTATMTASATPTDTATRTPTQTATATMTSTSTATDIGTMTPTSTVKPTDTLTPTVTATLTVTATPPPTDVSEPQVRIIGTAVDEPTDTPPPSTPTVVATLTPTVTPTAVVPSETPETTEEPGALAAQPTAAPTLIPGVVTEPTPSDDSGFAVPLELIIGGLLLLVVIAYIVMYFNGARAAERYTDGFVVEQCPVCRQGELHLDTRQERVLGVPVVRRSVRCDYCRSLLREMGTRRWRYAVDRLESPVMYARYNGKIVDDHTLIELAEKPVEKGGRTTAPVPPTFVSDDETD